MERIQSASESAGRSRRRRPSWPSTHNLGQVPNLSFDPSGLKNSHFTYIVTWSGARRWTRTTGVRPMVSRMRSWIMGPDPVTPGERFVNATSTPGPSHAELAGVLATQVHATARLARVLRRLLIGAPSNARPPRYVPPAASHVAVPWSPQPAAAPARATAKMPTVSALGRFIPAGPVATAALLRRRHSSRAALPRWLREGIDALWTCR